VRNPKAKARRSHEFAPQVLARQSTVAI